MKTLTDHLLPHAEAMDEYFVRGTRRASRHERELAFKLFQAYRAKRGFVGDQAPLLTPPSANAKLAKGSVPSYGLTLQHVTTRVKRGLVVNACPFAGDCIKVCVLNEGNGNRPVVIEARRAKVDFLVEQPRAFAYLLGWELARAQYKHGSILFRPNVNSDVRWDLILPSLFDDLFFAGAINSYGYTKDPFVLATNGWVTPSYRLAYSWNENTIDVDHTGNKILRFLERGGAVAMVTDRKKGAPLSRRDLAPWPRSRYRIAHTRYRDADKTDEWMFEKGVVGDLSAKGRARQLIAKSGFVVSTRGAT